MKKITFLCALFFGFNSFSAVVVRDIADYTFSSTNDNLAFDFNSDGTSEFTFQYNEFQNVFTNYNAADVNFVSTGTFASGHGWDIMKSLALNTLISSASVFAGQFDSYINPGFANANEIFPAGDSYVGTKFKIGANVHYGWILVNSTGGASGVIKIKSYAYNNVANQQITAGQSLGTDDFKSINYSVFPNPMNDNFQIESKLNSTDINVSVIDITGKTINLESNNDLYDVTSLNNGVYFLRIEDNEGNIEVKKIIKN